MSITVTCSQCSDVKTLKLLASISELILEKAQDGTSPNAYNIGIDRVLPSSSNIKPVVMGNDEVIRQGAIIEYLDGTEIKWIDFLREYGNYTLKPVDVPYEYIPSLNRNIDLSRSMGDNLADLIESPSAIDEESLIEALDDDVYEVSLEHSVYYDEALRKWHLSPLALMIGKVMRYYVNLGPYSPFIKTNADGMETILIKQHVVDPSMQYLAVASRIDHAVSIKVHTSK